MQGPIDVEPLMPRDRAVFTGLPAHAVMLDGLAPAIGDGVILVRHGGSWAVAVFRSGVRTVVVCTDGTISLEEVQRRPGATASAWRTHPEIAAVIPVVLNGDVVYSDLHSQWLDWRLFMADLAGREGSHVVVAQGDAGHAVSRITGGQHLLTFSDRHPEPGDASLIEDVVRGADCTLTVLREREQGMRPSSAAIQRAAVIDVGIPDGHEIHDAGAEDDSFTEIFGVRQNPAPRRYDAALPGPTVDALVPELKLIARSRLDLSSPRLEQMIERAAARHSSLVALCDDVRNTSIRGVMQSTLEQIADEMQALGVTGV